MKRMMTWLLVMLLMLAPTSALAETGALPSVEPVVDTIGLQQGTELIVGSTTQMSGHFATDMWGTNTADMDVRALLHGYSTVASMGAHGLAYDPTVVSDVEAVDNSDGSRTYTFTISTDLKYNNGERIAAQDYVFSLLLQAAPQIKEIGGTPRGMDYLMGFADYNAARAQALSGVRLLSDSSFSLRVTGEYRPYFYGLALLNVLPYPVSVIAPGCEVRDDGDGAYLAKSDAAGGMDAGQLGFEPGVFSKEMLEVTMLDPETGYLYNPRVTSGAYQLDSYDAAAHEARFSANTNYNGNYEGQKPHIERLVFRQLDNATMAAQLKAGEVGLINKITERQAIADAQALVAEDAAGQMGYARTGFAYLAFACEQRPTDSAAVRKAIAHCLDKPTLIADALGEGRALIVNGYYGLGQWMLNEDVPGAENEAGEPVIIQEEMAQYEVPFDLSAAMELLESDGWTLNEAGEAYDEGTRYKKIGEELVALQIRWAKSENNAIATEIEVRLKSAFAALGIGLQIDEMPFVQMLDEYYSASRAHNMFFLASNFTYLFDPYYEFNTADQYQGLVNATQLRDEQLMGLAREMRRTEPGDVEGYLTRWIQFQQRFVELLPMAPLYSNVYLDAYRGDLQNYNIAAHASWGLAIPYAYIADEPIAPPAEDATDEG